MTLLCDWQIAELIRERAMIEPASLHQVRENETGRVVSYGLSSAGYDIRLSDDFSVPQNGTIGDPHFPTGHIPLRSVNGAAIQIAAGHHILGVSMEKFSIPSDVVGVCVGKSTYARLGIVVNVTPLEPGWVGFLTLEIHNASARPVNVYPGQGIAQIMFHRISEPDTSYADRKGKYQDQPQKPVESKL